MPENNYAVVENHDFGSRHKCNFEEVIIFIISKQNYSSLKKHPYNIGYHITKHFTEIVTQYLYFCFFKVNLLYDMQQFYQTKNIYISKIFYLHYYLLLTQKYINLFIFTEFWQYRRKNKYFKAYYKSFTENRRATGAFGKTSNISKPVEFHKRNILSNSNLNLSMRRCK